MRPGVRNELTRLVERRKSQSQVSAEANKMRVDASYSIFITGTCDCFAGARLLLSRCCVELGRSALQA